MFDDDNYTLEDPFGVALLDTVDQDPDEDDNLCGFTQPTRPAAPGRARFNNTFDPPTRGAEPVRARDTHLDLLRSPSEHVTTITFGQIAVIVGMLVVCVAVAVCACS